MTTEELNTQLYEKILGEQEQYHQWILTQPPDEILTHAYEFTIREDILLSLEYNELPTKQAKALLKSPCPLDDIFRTWCKMETDHMQNIFSTIEIRANTVLQQDFSKSPYDSR